MKQAAWAVLVVLVLVGCGSRKSSLLLERYARGPIDDALLVGKPLQWNLTPVTPEGAEPSVLIKGQIEVTAKFASPADLVEFFDSSARFGSFAGRNPYYTEHMAFYIKIANRSQEKIFIKPSDFKLVDNRGNQLNTIGVDYVTAYAEYRAPVSTTTRGVIQGARPGYFGMSLPVGSFVARQPQWRFALLKQSSLQTGYLHPGVVHDGLVAFWSPVEEAKTLRLLITNIKTAFDAKDWPQTSLEFPFDFDSSHP